MKLYSLLLMLGLASSPVQATVVLPFDSSDRGLVLSSLRAPLPVALRRCLLVMHPPASLAFFLGVDSSSPGCVAFALNPLGRALAAVVASPVNIGLILFAPGTRIHIHAAPVTLSLISTGTPGVTAYFPDRSSILILLAKTEAVGCMHWQYASNRRPLRAHLVHVLYHEMGHALDFVQRQEVKACNLAANINSLVLENFVRVALGGSNAPLRVFERLDVPRLNACPAD